MKIEELRKDTWFRRNYVPVKLSEDVEVNLDDVQAVFDNIEMTRECTMTTLNVKFLLLNWTDMFLSGQKVLREAKLTKLPKNLMAKVLEQLPRLISSLDAHMENGLQNHGQHADSSIHEPPVCFVPGPRSQLSQDTVDLAHDGVAPHPGTMTQWLVPGMMTSHSHAGGVPHVQLFCGMHDTPTVGSSHAFSGMQGTLLVASPHTFVDTHSFDQLHDTPSGSHVTGSSNGGSGSHGVSSVTCAHSGMIQSRLMWGSLLQSSLLQSSTMQMSRGTGAERGNLHLVALVDVFSHPHLGVEDDIDFMYLASPVLIC
ncbi:Son of sevenless 2 [Stylosanthes scabra]|uniref:Son of sevenless 2 n=1 Tax=Stylosanthes scabra TaxID=79078 RepID=A0ABU6QH45_9FABA|nr:Son of sevenless 2 [Stylosanthes scabra]